MRNGYILSGSKWHIQNISFLRLQIFCLCSLFCFEQNRDTFLFVFAGSKLCTILVILFRVLLVTKVNNLPRYCAAQSAKPNLEVLSRTRTKARFFLLFTVLFSTIPSISSSARCFAVVLDPPDHLRWECLKIEGGILGKRKYRKRGTGNDCDEHVCWDLSTQTCTGQPYSIASSRASRFTTESMHHMESARILRPLTTGDQNTSLTLCPSR